MRLKNNVTFNKEKILSGIVDEDRATLKRKRIELAMKSLWFRPNKGGSRLGNIAFFRNDQLEFRFYGGNNENYL